MLALSKGALTAGQAESYYEEKYSRDDYYTEKQRVVGRWFGQGAAELGLTGDVDTSDFRAVLNGLNPHTGEVLVHAAQREGEQRRAGWDATFNAPKSVSVQALVGDDARRIAVPSNGRLGSWSASPRRACGAARNGRPPPTSSPPASTISPPVRPTRPAATATVPTRTCTPTSW